MRKANSKKNSETKKTETALTNPVLTLDIAVVGGRLVEDIKDTAKLSHPAEGLTLIEHTKDVQTFPALAQFPLGYSRAGRLTGKLMNISQFCRMKTGRAWNERHAASVLEKEGIKLPILHPEKDKDIKAELSKELDALRPKYYQASKGIVAAFMSRNDVEVQSAKVTSNANGIVVTSRAVLPTNKVNEADQLRKELDAKNNLIAALTAKLPPKVAKSVLKHQDKTVDIAAERTPLNTLPEIPAMVAGGEVTPTPSQDPQPVLAGKE